MIIQIDGVGTVNKGAELMLYAILQEIERTHPDATVIFNDSTFWESNKQPHELKSGLKVKKPYYMSSCFANLLKKTHIQGIVERFKPEANVTRFLHQLHHSKIDLLLNASGFRFSDQFNVTNDEVRYLESYLKDYKSQGTKIVYLPQAFGPSEKANTKTCLKALSDYSDLIFARESASYECLIREKLKSPPIYQYPDFTSLVKGSVPEHYSYLSSYVCLIPNMQMVNKGVVSLNNYLSFWNDIARKLKENGKPIFVLNHEGIGDEKLSNSIASNADIPCVNGLNAIETKGLISQSLLVISSRFHGVASALSSSVPCLATSWSHKYQLLFEEYGMNDCVLNVNDSEKACTRIFQMLDEPYNSTIRQHLSQRVVSINQRVEDMWNMIWAL